MRVHHLNCATMRPPFTPAMVAHVLLLERADGLVLVDTGLGTGDLDPRGRLGRAFVALARPALDPAETAVAQVRALGLDPRDVTDIALTHLDLDHAGGLGDFPDARVHVHAAELAAARNPARSERARYVGAQWAHGPRWAEHAETTEEWFGFPSVTVLSDDVVLIPLPGHTRGHTGVAVRRADGHWLLHAGDAFYSDDQVQDPPSCSRLLHLFQRAVAVHNARRVANLERLQELARDRSAEVTVFCAHDRAQLDALRS